MKLTLIILFVFFLTSCYPVLTVVDHEIVIYKTEKYKRGAYRYAVEEERGRCFKIYSINKYKVGDTLCFMKDTTRYQLKAQWWLR